MKTIIDYMTNNSKFTLVFALSIVVCVIIISLIAIFYKKSKQTIKNESDQNAQNEEKNQVLTDIPQTDGEIQNDTHADKNNSEEVSDFDNGIESDEDQPVETENNPPEENKIPDKKVLGENSTNLTEKNETVEDKTPTKYAGKWIISAFEGRYFADLKASNGEIMLRTESYSSLSGIKSGIDTLKKNIEMENYAISLDKNGNFVFKIFSTAKRLLCVGEGYSTREQCEKAFASVKHFSKTAVIVVNDKN